MSTELIWQTESSSLEDTLRLAEQIGRKLKGGEVIRLVSDLGGGKTAFVRGLAKGMGSQDVVRSPSFTLSNHYQGRGLTIHHFDFYRLEQPGIMREAIKESLTDEKVIVVVEWAHIIQDVLPHTHLTLRIKASSENSRKLTFQYPKELRNLISNNT